MQIKTTLSFSDCTLPVIYRSDRNAGSDAVHQTQSFSCTHTNIAWINNKSYYICSWINHHTIHRNTLMHTNVNRLEAPLKSENGEGVSRDVAFSASISLFPFLAKKIQLNRVLTKPDQWHNYNLFCFFVKVQWSLRVSIFLNKYELKHHPIFTHVLNVDVEPD